MTGCFRSLGEFEFFKVGRASKDAMDIDSKNAQTKDDQFKMFDGL
jgi:hypothetical protein